MREVSDTGHVSDARKTVLCVCQIPEWAKEAAQRVHEIRLTATVEDVARVIAEGYWDAFERSLP